MDYAEAAHTAPETETEIAFEALRACSSLLMAFTYEDAWPSEDRAAKKQGKRAARRIRDSFATEQGQQAISWIAQSYGRVMAEMRRKAAEQDDAERESYEATAEVDEWLAELVNRRWPVEPLHAALLHAREDSSRRLYEVDNPAAMVDLQAHAARVDATLEMLCLASWPAAEEITSALIRWTHFYDMGCAAALLSDWKHVSPHWANLIQPERRSYIEIAEQRVS